MVTTAPEIAAMETYFKGVVLPPIFKLNAATTINDLPGLVRRTLENVKNLQVKNRVIGSRWDDLLEIKRMVEESATG